MSLLDHPEWGEALALAMAEADPGSLAAAGRVRTHVSPEVAAAALNQAVLRRRAVAKFGDQAAELLFTASGLEQATRGAVARWRAERLVAAGYHRVIDLGVGIGADALAMRAAGMVVTGVEQDHETAAIARHNLSVGAGPQAQVLVGDALALADDLIAEADKATVVFLDPARRTDRGRSWRLQDLTPPWSFVEHIMATAPATVVKTGPLLPDRLVPDGTEVVVVSHQRQVVELGMWQGDGFEPGWAALVLPDAGPAHRLDAIPHQGSLPVAAPGRFVGEPDPAVIRAHVIAEAAPEAWLLDPGVAYVSADQVFDTPFITWFEVLEVLDPHVKSLRAWVRDRNIGTLEIKKRGVEIDPAQLRRDLRPAGRESATLVLTPTTAGVRALYVRRTPQGVNVISH